MSRISKRLSTKPYSSASPMENLEGRQMFTVTPAFIAPNTLTFVGDAANDTVNLYDNGMGGISGSFTNAGGTLTGFGVIPGIQNIRVATQAGNDHVNYVMTNDNLMGGAKYVNVDLGTGNDAARFYAANDIDLGPNVYFNMNVYAGAGDDYVLANYYGELDGQLRLYFDGQDGSDYLSTRAQFQFGSTGVFSNKSLGGFGDDSLEMNVRKDNPFDPVGVFAHIDGGAHVFGDKGARTVLATDANIEFLSII